MKLGESVFYNLKNSSFIIITPYLPLDYQSYVLEVLFS